MRALLRVWELKLTILREAHKTRIDALREPEIIDSLHILEWSARHFLFGPRWV
jgi:hypothetical protein